MQWPKLLVHLNFLPHTSGPFVVASVRCLAMSHLCNLTHALSSPMPICEILLILQSSAEMLWSHPQSFLWFSLPVWPVTLLSIFQSIFYYPGYISSRTRPNIFFLRLTSPKTMQLTHTRSELFAKKSKKAREREMLTFLVKHLLWVKYHKILTSFKSITLLLGIHPKQLNQQKGIKAKHH